ncbi:LysM peptidoglycan-binding domain-containing protein [Bacillus salipaludis]|uniref:LysM peptidoglycan-binding domain-containing protein n=1 Tax=Bacillus salipaludis TaxID=2547811 RepID=UPI003D257748
MSKKGISIVSLVLMMFLNISPALAANNPRNTYEVKSGDTLWKIASTYGTTATDLKLINGLQQPDLLLVGQKLRVPIMYEVVAGDTLWKLSQAFNSSVSLIKSANGLTSNVIYVGQKLKIIPTKLTMSGQFVLMTREQFRDWLFNQKITRKITFFQEHHTYSPSYKNFNGSNYFTLMNSMKDYHVNEMGWSDISQQLTTFPDGTVVLGRPFNTPPQGSFGLTNKSVTPSIEANAVAIENVGNFDVGYDQMTAEQRETIITVAALFCIKFGLTPSVDSITYHHWWDMNTGERVLDNNKGHAVKTCPGTGFFGGNSTTDAKNNFYPLVTKKMQEILATM